MIKTKFVFAVSIVAILAVSSSMAASVTDAAPATGAGQAISGATGTVGDVYDWSKWSGYATEGIASVNYVNNAVDAAGNAAQWAENHAAAAGTAAKEAGEAAETAKNWATEAKNTLADKQDKKTAVKVTTSGTEVGSATVPVYVNSSGVATPITSYSGNAASATKATQDGNGKVIADTYATKTELAKKQDPLKAGTNITIASDGTISAKDTVYTLPAASDTTLGGVKVDTALSSTSTNPVQNKVINTALAGKLSTSGTAAKATADASGNNIVNTYATKSALTAGLATKQGTLKAGANIAIASDGTISATDTVYTLPAATANTLGGVKLYTNLGTNQDGTVTQNVVNNLSKDVDSISAKYDNLNGVQTSISSRLDEVEDDITGLVDDKVDIDQGSTNANKIMITNASGNVAPVAITDSGNGSLVTGVSIADGKLTVTKGSSLPTVNNATLTIQKNGTAVGTFTANSSANKTIDITVPTGALASKSTITNADVADNAAIAAGKIDGLATVATSGSYNDLTGKPTIPTVNNATLTIKNGATNTNLATFTANQSSAATATIPAATPSVAGLSKIGVIPSGSATSTTYATIWVE